MIGSKATRIATAIPFVCSALAFAIVIANVIAGVPPKPDEDASAHLWQLLMLVQLPFIMLFAATSDWQHHRQRTVTLLPLQGAAIAAAAIPVWLAGY